MASRSRLRTVLAAAAAVAVPVAVVSCGSSGRELRAPEAGVTAQTRVPDPSVTTSVPIGNLGSGGPATVGFTLPAALPPTVLDLTSPAWAFGETLPATYGCGSTSPPVLTWNGPPEETAELAVFAVDLDAGEVLWTVLGIPAVTTELDITAMPPGAATLPNSRGNSGWDGPCTDGTTHTVQFEVVALPDGFTPGVGDPRQVRDSLFGQAVAYGLLSAPVTGGN